MPPKRSCRRGQPTLFVSSREDPCECLSLESTSTDNIFFAADGDEDERETPGLEDTHWRSKADQTVRFQEHVQVIVPLLRSTSESREAGTYSIVIVLFSRLFAHRSRLPAAESICIFTEFELDSDNLDDDAVAHMNLEHGIRQGDLHREQPIPLLFGLLDASGVKRSLGSRRCGLLTIRTSTRMSLLPSRRRNAELDS